MAKEMFNKDKLQVSPEEIATNIQRIFVRTVDGVAQQVAQIVRLIEAGQPDQIRNFLEFDQLQTMIDFVKHFQPDFPITVPK